MNKLLTIIIIFIYVNTFSQNKHLIDYFYSQDYSQKEYKWKAGIKEFELSKKDNELIVSVNKKMLSNGMIAFETNYFHPFESKIINTQYKNNYTNRFKQIGSIILKPSGSEWIENTDGGFYSFITKQTNVKTDYKYYEDCISVKKIFNTTDPTYKDKFDVYYTISYYAYKIGLVKVETYRSDSNQKAEAKNQILDKQLVDNSKSNSIFSFNSNNLTITVDNKRTIKVKKGDSIKIVSDRSQLENYTPSEVVKYYTVGENIVIEIGYNDEYQGYAYEIYIINAKTLNYWVFDTLCMNWDDLFYFENNKLYYVCEYQCNEKGYIFQLDFINKRGVKIGIPNCNYLSLKKIKGERIINFINVDKK